MSTHTVAETRLLPTIAPTSGVDSVNLVAAVTLSRLPAANPAGIGDGLQSLVGAARSGENLI